MSGPSKTGLKTARHLPGGPVPLVVLGAGAAWLAADQVRKRAGAPHPIGYADFHEGYDDGVDAPSDLDLRMAAARARLGGVVEKTREGASSLARGLRAVAYRREARRKLGAHVEAEVIAASAIGLILGLAIGVAVASRRR